MAKAAVSLVSGSKASTGGPGGQKEAIMAIVKKVAIVAAIAGFVQGYYFHEVVVALLAS
jgi:hypothetical protein